MYLNTEDIWMSGMLLKGNRLAMLLKGSRLALALTGKIPTTQQTPIGFKVYHTILPSLEGASGRKRGDSFFDTMSKSALLNCSSVLSVESSATQLAIGLRVD